jgi:glycosyltransferase involved in cell wall biosynthesis
MKIAVSTLSDVSMNEGTSVRAKRVFELLQKKYDCTLIIRGGHRSKSEKVVVISPSKLWNFQLIPVVLKNRFDLIYCSNDFWGFLTYFTLARLWTCKVIFEAHGILSVEREYSLSAPGPVDKVRIKVRQWREKFVVKHADCVIALSLDIFNFYRRFNNDIVLIPVFLDEQRFKPQESSNERTSDHTKEKFVGVIGPFIQGNINNYFLDFVFRNLGAFDEHIKFIIIGECDHKPRNARVRYTGYLRDVQEYVDQLTLLDAVLVPSKFPSFGPLNKILEPMACSLPVFTTTPGAVGLEHIRPGENIFICDESEIVAKVNESLFDVELMERVGKNARRTIETYYGTEVNNKKLIEVIERLGTPS